MGQSCYRQSYCKQLIKRSKFMVTWFNGEVKKISSTVGTDNTADRIKMNSKAIFQFCNKKTVKLYTTLYRGSISISRLACFRSGALFQIVSLTPIQHLPISRFCASLGKISTTFAEIISSSQRWFTACSRRWFPEEFCICVDNCSLDHPEPYVRVAIT